MNDDKIIQKPLLLYSGLVFIILMVILFLVIVKVIAKK